MTMTTAATRLRSHLASIYGDTRKAARLREQADTLARLRHSGDEADRLVHEMAVDSAKRRARWKAKIANAIRADRDSR
jgi:hypothetical protein